MNFKSNDLKEFRNSKGLLIDVRSPEEYYKGHMPFIIFFWASYIY